jgi:NAD(P)-dependent dehydrogenase (short-subunit alcohol dehydrogenase family)
MTSDRYAGKSVLVTGASSGIGEALARTLAGVVHHDVEVREPAPELVGETLT